MTNKLEIKAEEGSSYGVVVDFIERRSDSIETPPVIPKTPVLWFLYEEDGTLRNSGSEDANNRVVIVLSGTDLAVPNAYPIKLYLNVRTTFDSEYGDDLPLITEVELQIENLVGES